MSLKARLRRLLLAGLAPLLEPTRRAIRQRQRGLLVSFAAELIACWNRSLLHPAAEAGSDGSQPYSLRLASALTRLPILLEDPSSRSSLEVFDPAIGVDLLAASYWLEQPGLHLRWPLPWRASAFHGFWQRHAAPCYLPAIQRLDSLGLPLEPAAMGIPFEQRPFGVNLIGHAYNVFGIGEDARAITAALRAAAIPCCVIDHPAENGSATTDRSLQNLVLPPGEEGPYAFNLVCMAAPIHARWVCQEGLRQQSGRYTIVSWPWETERWPQAWEAPLALADEAWPFSSLIETALSPFASPAAGRSWLQITRMPPPAEIHDPARYDNPLSRRSAREHFGLPQDRVLFVFGFDLNSTLTRKNPMAVVEAFQRAFPANDRLGDRVALVIKTLPSASAQPTWDKLRRGIEQDCRLHVIEASLDRSDLLALYGSCDIFVSLHRSEGLGRGHAEALQLGLDVIVTNYGSTRDFCTGPRAHPVRYRLVPIAEGEYFEHEGQVWADPDVDHAAEVMREVALSRLTRPHQVDDPITAGFRQRFSASAVGSHYRKRLEELWNQRVSLAAGLKVKPVMTPGMKQSSDP